MHCILRVSKLKTVGAVAGSCAHTFRDRETPNADAQRTHRNAFVGAASTKAVLAAMRARLPAKRRKDAVLCLEYLVTASPAFFAEKKSRSDYFSRALKWLREKHGAQNVVCAAIHRDETTPHMVAYVVPLTADGRLSAKDFVGGPQKLTRMQTEFHQAVGAPFGLQRGLQGSKAKHTTLQRFYGALNTAPSLPGVTAVDHVAAAVGIQTRRMAARRAAEEALLRRATVAGISTMQQLGTKVRTLTNELQRRGSEARRGRDDAVRRGEELQNVKRAGAEEVEALHREVSRLSSALKVSQDENANWVDRLQSLSAEFGAPAEQLLTMSPVSDQRKNRNVPR
jgi:hypothetical protein